MGIVIVSKSNTCTSKRFGVYILLFDKCIKVHKAFIITYKRRVTHLMHLFGLIRFS